jgi:hypothetical protein
MRNIVSLGVTAGKHAAVSASWLRLLSPASRAEVTASAGYKTAGVHATIVHCIGQHKLELHGHVRTRNVLAQHPNLWSHDCPPQPGHPAHCSVAPFTRAE